MEWQQVMGFYHVAKLRSFTRAAEATYRTQSALTQQIKALEKEFGCQLLERIGKRKIMLTPVGERFFRFSESLLLEYDRLREDMAEHKGLKKGRLRIAAPFTTLYQLLPEVIKKYNRQFPWVEISLFDRPQREVVELVKNGDVDLGIASESIIPGELIKQRWKKVEPVLLTRAGHPLSRAKKVSLEKIAQCPLILPPKSSEFLHRSKLEELFRRHHLSYLVVMESSNIELSSLYVEMGLGVSFASIVRDLPVFKKRKLEYLSLSHFLVPEYICIAARKDKKMTSFQDSFLDMLFSG
ncbi:MAG: LysR family transcriptional regulator [Nitrospirae bacterium]|nr:LysR family transcriptional regulator [Nitrospirota bacterium]